MSLTKCKECGCYSGEHSDKCTQSKGQMLVSGKSCEEFTYAEDPESAFSIQVGGSHYKQYSIQPYEFFYRNNIPHHKSAIIRRILRYDHPTGKGLTDLRKIQHEIDLIIELAELNK